MRRLSNETLAQVRSEVIRPAYDRAATRIGVVHFGPGAFHRAHQAWYVDRALSVDPGLAISAVSLRSDTLRAALAPQDGLYSLTEREADPTVRVIGAIKEVLTAPASPEAVFARLADPAVRLVTATVTEKGYCLTGSGELDLDHPEIRHDLRAETPQTLAGWLTEGLKRRRAAGHGGLAAISCDNLSGNGTLLGRAVSSFARARGEAGLADWIEGEVAFPNSMVDSITPATDEALRAQAAERLGLTDAWPVQRERFTQWVVEDRLGAEADVLAAAGVTLAQDVADFERAKLRLLNGAHSTLAYVGLGLGYQTVAQAMADPVLAGFIERLMREDIAASLKPTAGLDLDAYIAAILRRFRNPAISHQLSQIAWDGSQKLPLRLGGTIAEALDGGRPVDRLATGIAAWIAFVRRQTLTGVAIVDPLRERLAAASGLEGADFLDAVGVFSPELSAAPAFRRAVADARDGTGLLA